MTSQPSLSAIVAATATTERDTGLSLDALLALEPYWEAVRGLYAPLETGLKAPTGRVYRHEIPGGQLSNLRQQAVGVGLAERFEEVEAAYERADRLLGHIVKVTPSSKVVGDLALYVVSAGIDLDELEADPASFDLPDSVLDFLRGGIGKPPGGFPQPFTDKALEGRGAAPAPLEVDDELARHLDAPGAERRRALSEVLFPGPVRDYDASWEEFGDVSLIPTRAFFGGLAEDEELAVDLDPGVRVIYELEAVGEPDDHAVRTVLVRVNGQLRPVEVRDRSIEASAAEIERADPSQAGHVAAPVTGVVTLSVAEGDAVEAGRPVATLEAMKMESTISAPIAGTVQRIAASTGGRLEQGDLVLVIAEG